MDKAKSEIDFDVMVLRFSDSAIPNFKEVSNKDYILCGEKNDYPEYLIHQYNKCGKHRAIINSKVKYILGDGVEGIGGLAMTEDEQGQTSPARVINSDDETMYDVLQKSIKDIEIHGGFRWFITYDKTGKPADIKHVDFFKLRTAKPKDVLDKEGKKIGQTGEGYWFKEKWILSDGRASREEAVFYPEFTGVGKDVQMFAYNEYGPGTDYYPLPEYVGCANYIDTDIEISKFHLSAIRNGMMPSKMVQFYTGEPTEDKKKEIEKRFAGKFGGSENAGKFVLVFNSDKSKEVNISDLSGSELDKMFEVLGKTVQQEIFIGHNVISPMLFGVKTEGQLGGSTELKIAYEIFINTYAKPKQANLEKVINYFGGLMGLGNGYKFKQLDPIGITLDIKDFISAIPIPYVLEKLGIPKKYLPAVVTTPAPVNVTGETALQPQAQPLEQSGTNDNIKNLTAKQHQQLVRIIRQYSKEQLTLEAAKVLLRTGLGLTEDDINTILGVEPDEPLVMRAYSSEMIERNINEDLRQAEVEAAIKPKLKLNFITDENVLNKKIMYPVSGKMMKIPVSKVQAKIVKRLAEIENELNLSYNG